METRLDRPTDLDALRNPERLRTGRGAALDRAEREARTRRVIAVGAMASFVGFFGLAAAGDIGQAIAPPLSAVPVSPQVAAGGAAATVADPLPAAAATVPSASQPAVVVNAPAARPTHTRTGSS